MNIYQSYSINLINQPACASVWRCPMEQRKDLCAVCAAVFSCRSNLLRHIQLKRVEFNLPSGWNYPGPSQGFGPGLIGPSVQQYFEVVNILWWNPLWRAWPPSWLALNTLHGSLSADVRANSSRHLGICRVQRVMEGVMPHKKTYRYGTVSCLGTDISGASCRKLVVWRTLIQVVNMHCISGRTPTPLHLSRINLQSPRTNIDQWWYCFYRLHHWLF